MNISNVITLLGGVAMFLFGMSLMGDGLKKVAGSKMEMVLYKLSGTPLKGVLLGTGVTAIIQSSSATSVMVVGFVNSGMMSLPQATAVIQGALIGTSITGWIICLSYINGSGWVSLLSTSTIAAVFAVVGIVIRMTSKKSSTKHIGDILLGFTVLMFGMQTMSGAVAPLKDSPAFISILTSFSNPILGIVVGVASSAVLQSASAAIGILQALSVTGAMTFSSAYPMILGIAVGAAVPVLLSSIGAKADGRRSAFMYLIIEVIAAVVFAVIYYGLEAAGVLSLGDILMNPFSIATVNSIFRILTAMVLMPFDNRFIALSQRIIKISENEKNENAIFDRLDERFLSHPSLAIEQSHLTVNDMAEAARRNFNDAVALVGNYSEKEFAKVEKDENIIDGYEDKIGTYLVRLNAHELNKKQNDEASKILHTLSDFERISDHAMNTAEVARDMYSNKVEFSPEGKKELGVLISAVSEIMELAIRAFKENDISVAYRVEPLEEHIDDLCDEMKIRHVTRLKAGICSLEQGFPFTDLLTNFERVADHCSNIALALIELDKDAYDTHSYVLDLKEMRAHDFDRYFAEYSERFSI